MEVLRDHGVDAAAESLQAAKSGLVLPWLKQQLPNLSGTLAALQGADHPKLAALEQTLVEHFSGPAAAAGGWGGEGAKEWQEGWRMGVLARVCVRLSHEVQFAVRICVLVNAMLL